MAFLQCATGSSLSRLTFVVFSVAPDNTTQQRLFCFVEKDPQGETPGPPCVRLWRAHVLTFSDGEWRVGEVESHQLGRELAEEAAGHGAVEERALVAHRIHQRDGLGGVGRAHDLNDMGAKGKETGQIR